MNSNKSIVAITNTNSLERENDVIIVNGEAFTFKATGLTRRVYVNKDKTKVVKVCVERYNNFNQREIDVYLGASDEKRKELAETSILDNGYIIQEFLHTLDDPETQNIYPLLTMPQIRFAQSCRNDVGFDKDGNLKCYDLEEFKQY